MPTSVDVGILTFREDEFASVLERFPPEQFVNGRRIYNIGRVPLRDGGSLSVAAIRCVDYLGGGDGGSALRDLLEELTPQLVLVVGGVIGVPSKQLCLGDVVVATHVAEPEVAGEAFASAMALDEAVLKWASNLPAYAAAMPSWSNEALTGSSPRLVFSGAGTGSRDEALATSIERHFESEASRGVSSSMRWVRVKPPRPLAGTIIATVGEADAARLRSGWPPGADQVLAIEERTRSVYRAAHDAGVPVMSIRGVGELLGLPSQEEWWVHGCRLAASFARAFLSTGPVEPRTP